MKAKSAVVADDLQLSGPLVEAASLPPTPDFPAARGTLVFETLRVSTVPPPRHRIGFGLGGAGSSGATAGDGYI